MICRIRKNEDLYGISERTAVTAYVAFVVSYDIVRGILASGNLPTPVLTKEDKEKVLPLVHLIKVSAA